MDSCVLLECIANSLGHNTVAKKIFCNILISRVIKKITADFLLACFLALLVY